MTKNVLLKDVPRRCIKCDSVTFTGAPRPKISKKALGIGAIGLALTALWIVGFVMFSPVYITPRGLGGIFLCALVYGWPFYVSVIIGRLVPSVVIAKCFKCKHSETFSIGKPQL